MEDLLAGHLAQDALHRAVRAVVAVADRVLEEPAARVEEPVVHPPGVDPDGGEVLSPGRGRRLRRRQALPEAVEDPAERPAQAARPARRRVVEPADLLEDEAARLHAAEHRPSASRAEVEREVEAHTMPAPPPVATGRSAALFRR